MYPNETNGSNGYQDMYPQLELNQENINNLNQQFHPNYTYPTLNQHQQQQQHPNPQLIPPQIPQNQIGFHSNNSSPNFVSEVPISQHSSPTSLEEIKQEAHTKKINNLKLKRQLDEQDAILIAKDDSELLEEELLLKRKAQNRQAQRAFRERKETRLKDLQSKLDQSEQERQQLLDQLACIRQQNISITTENQMLKNSQSQDDSTSNYSSNLSNSNRKSSVSSSLYYDNNRIKNHKFNFPTTEQHFIDGLISGTGHSIENRDIRITYDSPENGAKLLGIGAVWDYLLLKAEENEIDAENIDIKAIMTKLRGHEICHGYGPAYPLDLVEMSFVSQVGKI